MAIALSERICSRCHEPKPLDQFYVKDKKSGRLYTWCKPCHKIRIGPKPPKEPLTERECSSCHETKAIDSFRLHRTSCRKCEQAKNSADPRAREYQARYSKRHHQERLELYHRYNQEHAEERAEKARQLRLENPELNREAVRRYHQTHPGYSAVSFANRRARILNSNGKFTKSEWGTIKDRYDHTCLMCGRMEPEIQLTPDHVTPLVKGGSNLIDNIQPLCRSCNSRKHVKVLDLRPLMVE